MSLLKIYSSGLTLCELCIALAALGILASGAVYHFRSTDIALPRVAREGENFLRTNSAVARERTASRHIRCCERHREQCIEGVSSANTETLSLPLGRGVSCQIRSAKQGEIVLRGNGTATPASLELSTKTNRCVISVSLRGQIRSECND